MLSLVGWSYLGQQEGMSSCPRLRHGFLLSKETCPACRARRDMSSCKEACLLARQEDMSSRSTRRHVFLFDRKACRLVRQEGMSSCSTRKCVLFLFDKMTCLLVRLEDLSSCLIRRHVFLFDKKTRLLAQQTHVVSKRTWPLVQQKDVSPC